MWDYNLKMGVRGGDLAIVTLPPYYMTVLKRPLLLGCLSFLLNLMCLAAYIVFFCFFMRVDSDSYIHFKYKSVFSCDSIIKAVVVSL